MITIDIHANGFSVDVGAKGKSEIYVFNTPTQLAKWLGVYLAQAKALKEQNERKQNTV